MFWRRLFWKKNWLGQGVIENVRNSTWKSAWKFFFGNFFLIENLYKLGISRTIFDGIWMNPWPVDFSIKDIIKMSTNFFILLQAMWYVVNEQKIEKF